MKPWSRTLVLYWLLLLLFCASVALTFWVPSPFGGAAVSLLLILSAIALERWFRPRTGTSLTSVSDTKGDGPYRSAPVTKPDPEDEGLPPFSYGRWVCPKCGAKRLWQDSYHGGAATTVGKWVAEGRLRRSCPTCEFIWFVRSQDAS